MYSVRTLLFAKIALTRVRQPLQGNNSKVTAAGKPVAYQLRALNSTRGPAYRGNRGTQNPIRAIRRGSYGIVGVAGFLLMTPGADRHLKGFHFNDGPERGHHA